MPIHRVMSSKDPYGKNDDTGAGLLTFGLSRDKPASPASPCVTSAQPMTNQKGH